MTRGVERRKIYLDDVDRRFFLKLLEAVVVERAWRIYAYVLMANHYHLFFATPQPNLSRGMQDLNGEYAAYFNHRYDRVGHLFGGRFKGYLVDSDAYYLEVARYIVLNPVRAGLVADPREWRWSSYRPTARIVVAPSWLDTSQILNCFHRTDRDVAAEGYRRFVAAGVGKNERPWPDEVEEALNRIRAALPDINASSAGRAAFILLARRDTTATVQEIAQYLGISRQSVHRMIRASEDRLKNDRSVRALFTAARSFWGQTPTGSRERRGRRCGSRSS